MGVAMQQARDETALTFARRREIDDVHRTAGFQHAKHVGQRRALFIVRQVMQHERRQHAIERRVRIRDCVAKALHPLDRAVGPFGFLPGDVERVRIRVERHDVDLRLALLAASR